MTRGGARSTEFLALNCHAQLDRVVGRMNQILLRAKIALGRLYGGVAQQQLDLLKLAARGTAELRAWPAKVMGGDSRDTGRCGIQLDELPDDLFAQALAPHRVRPVHATEN